MKKNLSRNPQNITPNFWYYEEPEGLMIVHRIENNEGEYIRTDQILIPWREILNSVKRYIKTK